MLNLTFTSVPNPYSSQHSHLHYTAFSTFRFESIHSICSEGTWGEVEVLHHPVVESWCGLL